ncbi:MAG: ribosome biogenesis GTPase Der [Alphaproteobacteria bacterium]|nr:ribosome biogenesis GTPase Der [Alphaproteobacteria bacterium]MBU6472462.1 ribosome biogenesis GTPase Der [Alphaproteobacteria bacterium]MDE2013157.1 ribosome biogenesis GTPase Der [Alphaproteobacteria bacterium]MDE2072774.1 ribosome biogenesis GTPase Der [Alphaproteobacteria bacterium]
MSLTVAIIGRPNVGKSTLFNRLAGRRLAIVHDTPGVTRDRQEAEARLGPVSFRLIDTAGFESGPEGSLTQRMTEQTKLAIAEASVCLFVVDGREGVTAGDEIIAESLRRSAKPVILVANKCESRASDAGLAETYALGFGEPVAISAEHGVGMADLLAVLTPFAAEAEEKADEEEEAPGNRPLKLAIVGRPNVGKSSLFNRLLGEDRALTGPEAGITRDAITAPFEIAGRAVLIHDTAGMRKKARVAGKTLEEMSVGSTLAAVRFAECVIVMIDATAPFEKQDLTIADLIAREGRAIVFAINKWDLVPDKSGAIKRLREMLDRSLPQVAGAPLVAVSALTGEGLERLKKAVIEADAAWNSRVPTAQLNRFLAEALERHPPPAVHGRRVRIRYMTQTKARPPSFALFGNQLDALPEAYTRYLANGLREAFGLKGVPIRFLLRTSKNPYAEE